MKEQLTPEWFAAHTGRITSSTAAMCLRLHPFEGAVAAYRRITAPKQHVTNWYKDWGMAHEARACSVYECQTGRLCDKTGFWVHPFFDWLGASPDRLIDDDGMLETKCPQKLPTSTPLHYVIQMQVQLAVTGREWCDFFAWTPSGTYSDRIYANEHEAARLINALEEFFECYIKPGVQPPMRGQPPEGFLLETFPVETLAQQLDDEDPIDSVDELLNCSPFRNEFQD